MKILWVSNAPWVGSGYGNQTQLFMPRIKALGHEMSCLAFYGHEGGPANYDGIPIFGNGFAGYGADMIGPVTQLTQADLTITLIDAWVYRSTEMFPQARWAPWFPVDMEPLPAAVSRAVKTAYKRLVFSKFGEKMVNDAGMDCVYIPHGVDTSQYKPYDRQVVRDALHWPNDRYVVGMVAANKGNPSRKAFTPQLEAFAKFKAKHPEAALYMHTIRHYPAVGGNNAAAGVNLPEFCDFLGLKWAQVGQPNWQAADVWFSPHLHTIYGFPTQYMAQMYSALDVFMLVSMGEGFGIPILEAQACGVPVIVGDWTAMSELCFSGWKVRKQDSMPWWTPLAGYQFYPKWTAILDKLEQAYKHSGDSERRLHALERAVEYDADLITERYWKPFLDETAGIIEDQAVKLVKFS